MPVDSRDSRSPARRDKQRVYLHLLLPPCASLVAVQSLLTSRLQIQTPLVSSRPPTPSFILFMIPTIVGREAHLPGPACHCHQPLPWKVDGSLTIKPSSFHTFLHRGFTFSGVCQYLNSNKTSASLRFGASNNATAWTSISRREDTSLVVLKRFTCIML